MLALVIGMLKEDRGYGVWKKYDEFARPLFVFEDFLHEVALSTYNAAMKRNLILQVATVVLALPALFLFVSRIRIERKARYQLLMGVERNDRSFVFDPGILANSSADGIIETSIQNMRRASDFISNLAAGNYSAHWEGWSPACEPLNRKTLSGTLLNLREQLRKAKQEDDQRNWSNEGLTQFSELIRNNQGDFQQLSDRSISFFCKSVQAHQGSLYVLESNGEKTLHLASCYATEKWKSFEEKITVGSGLVGQAFLDGDVVQLDNIPKDYIKISSGLGKASPNHLAIVPMKYNLQTIAIIEIASFTTMEDYQIDFLLRAGAFLASAILNNQAASKITVLAEQEQMKRQG